MESVTEGTHETVENLDFDLPRAAPLLERHAKRTILLLDLSITVVHSDILTAIRGGQLLEVYLRKRQRSASVSFVYEEDAKAFYDYVRKHGLYIRNKRVRAADPC